MTMNIGQAIAWNYPNASPSIDYRVEDNGNGPQLNYWNVKDTSGKVLPKPSSQNLKDWYFAFRQQDKINQLMEAYNNALGAGFTSSALGDPHTYGFKESDRTELTEATALANSGYTNNIPFKAGWVVQFHTPQQIQQVTHDAADFKITLYNNLQTKVAQVMALTESNTDSDWDAIEW